MCKTVYKLFVPPHQTAQSSSCMFTENMKYTRLLFLSTLEAQGLAGLLVHWFVHLFQMEIFQLLNEFS